MNSENKSLISSTNHTALSYDEYLNNDDDNGSSNNQVETITHIDTTLNEDDIIESDVSSEEEQIESPPASNISSNSISKSISQPTPSINTVRLTNAEQEPPKKLHNLIKIAPKPTAISQPVKSKSGQVLLLQGPGGTTVPVRVSNTSASTSGLQFIRTSDGNIIQVQKKPININQLQVNAKKILNTGVTTNNSGSLVIRTSNGKLSTVVKGASNSSGHQVYKAIPSGDGTTAKIQKIIPTTTVGNLTSANTSKVMVKSIGADGKPIYTPKLVRLPNQAIQVQGKSGIQYVRVLNSTSGLAQRTTVNPTTTLVKSKISTSTTSASPVVVRQSTAAGNRPVQVLVRSPKTDSYTIQEIQKNKLSTLSTFQQKNILSTIPTLRKIDSSRVQLVSKSSDCDKNDLHNKLKITELNKEIKRISFSLDGTNQQRQKPTAIAGTSRFSVSSGQSENKKIVIVTNSQNREKNDIIPLKRPFPNPEPNEITAKRLYNIDEMEVKEMEVKQEINCEDVKEENVSPLGDGDSNNGRKHCNCSKSQCLKLYCDCFANGEFCQDCNCKDCLNNLQFEDERQKAIKICLDRNPSAFKPKITASHNESDLRLHNKGCNCKRSGCLKNYCECYEAKIPCSSNCKCVGCRNIEDRPDLDLDPLDVQKITQTFSRSATTKRAHDEMEEKPLVNNDSDNASSLDRQQPCNFITQDVVDATVQCMIAQADNCQRNSMSRSKTEKMILEELGRCLVEIIDFSIRNMEGN